VKFKRPELEEELRTACAPELRRLLEDFDRWSPRVHLPEPMLTCLGRTPAQNRAVGGVPTSLHLWSGAGEVQETRAADLSTWRYLPEQLELVLTWFRGEVAKRGGAKRWELLHHNVQTGQHLHVGLRRSPLPQPPATA